MTGWYNFISKVVPCVGNGCKFDDTLVPLDLDNLEYNDFFIQCATLADCSLYYNTSTDRYSYNTVGSPSGFTRVISVTLIAPEKEIRVRSTVSWSRNSVTYSVSFSDNLLKWKE